MNIDDILYTDSAVWLILAFMALFVTALILLVLLITSERRKHFVIRLVAAVLCIGTAIGIYAREADRIAVAKETVVGGFAEAYGIELDDRDVDELAQVDRKDVTRNLETADGSLKRVLFRVVDDVVLPYTLDSAGTWTPMPAHQITR